MKNKNYKSKKLKSLWENKKNGADQAEEGVDKRKWETEKEVIAVFDILYFYKRNLEIKADTKNSKFGLETFYEVAWIEVCPLVPPAYDHVVIYSRTSDLSSTRASCNLSQKHLMLSAFICAEACLVKTKRQVRLCAWFLKSELFSCLACCRG